MNNVSSQATDTVTAELRKAMDGTIGIRNPKPAVLDHARDTAHQLVYLLSGSDAPALDALEKDLPADLRAWLFELPSFLSKKGREAEGHQLCDLLAPILGEPYLEAERAIVLSESGKPDAARAKIEECEQRFGTHAWVMFRKATLFEERRQMDEAEECYRKAIEKSRESGNRKDLRFAFDALIQFYSTQGNQPRMVESSREFMEEFPEIKEELKVEQIVNDAPKIGRNDPCTCGSGKKFKKCCGAAG